MRIAVFGASLVSAYRNGAATYYRGVLRALANRGHAVRFYEPLDEERLAHRDVIDPPWAEIVRFAPDGEGVEAALDQASSADVLIKSSDLGVFDEVIDVAVPQCTREGALSIYWDLEPARTLARMEGERRDPLRAQLPWYDLVLVRYGADAVIEAFQALGARTCFPVYQAVDTQTHYPVTPEPNCRAEAVVLAHRRDERDAQIERHYFDIAASLPEYRFILGGCGWENVPMPANVRYVGYVYTAEHNAYYASSTVALNLTHEPTARLGYAPTSRLFEAAGVGACVLSDAWNGIENFFEPGREIVLARDMAEMVEQLANLGAERAASIGRRAAMRCRMEHTYDHRAAELEALLEGFDWQWVMRTAL